MCQRCRERRWIASATLCRKCIGVSVADDAATATASSLRTCHTCRVVVSSHPVPASDPRCPYVACSLACLGPLDNRWIEERCRARSGSTPVLGTPVVHPVAVASPARPGAEDTFAPSLAPLANDSMRSAEGEPVEQQGVPPPPAALTEMRTKRKKNVFEMLMHPKSKGSGCDSACCKLPDKPESLDIPTLKPVDPEDGATQDTQHNSDTSMCRQCHDKPAQRGGKCLACAGSVSCVCPGGTVCRRKRKHAVGGCAQSAQIGAKFQGLCRACAPEARVTCNCDAGLTCRRNQEHGPGDCTQSAQSGEKFQGLCRACAPEARLLCKCKGGPICGRKRSHPPGGCVQLAQTGEEWNGLCHGCGSQAIVSSMESVPCACVGHGPCSAFHEDRFAPTGCCTLGPCPGRSKPGRICSPCARCPVTRLHNS